MVNHYETLGIPPGATPAEVKSAYRQRAREVHPDHAGNEAQFRALREAYMLLSDPNRRAEYDTARRDWMLRIGALECPVCANANRITRRPSAQERVRCWRCKTPLSPPLSDVLQAQRQSLLNEAARLVDEVGVDLADLAADAVHAGIQRLRRQMGLRNRNE